MKNNIIIFFVSLIVGVGGGFLFFQSGGQDDLANSPEQQEEQVEQPSENETNDSGNVVATNESSILAEKGCLSCHAASALDLDGGVTGPDLSEAYVNVEGKHGKPLNEFLKEPTSAVMSSVIAGNPLTEDEISKIVEELKIASEK